ncbi:hypothetical protein AB3N59_07270 [Leptospira sp. WS92.C1]
MRTIYGHFSNLHHEKIIFELERKYNFEPVYWLSTDSIFELISKKYDNLIFHDTILARRNIRPNGFLDSDYPALDELTLLRYSNYESIALSMMNRFDSDGSMFPYTQRIEYYYAELRYWIGVINSIKPDLFVSYVVPHAVTDYILYAVCKENGIPVLMIDATAIVDKYFLITNSIEDHSKSIKTAMRVGSSLQVKYQSDIDNFLARLRSSYSIAMPKYMDMQKKYSELNSFWKEKNADLKMLLRGIFGSNFPMGKQHVKINRIPLKKEGSTLKEFSYVLYKYQSNRRKRKLKKIYSNIAMMPDFKNKYIYFAANYQPEATTSPSAGVFVYLLMILRMISYMLPDGWKIYYKEHPATFWPIFEGDMCRSEEYYELLMEIPNLQVVPLETSSFELIDSSRAVASATGTAVLEGVVRGKPGLLFGESWFSGMKSIYRIRTNQDLEAAFKEIEKGILPNEKDIRSYLSAACESSFPDLLIRDYNERINQVSDPDLEMRKIADAIGISYNRLILDSKQSN